MKSKLFRKHASVIPTGAKRSGGIPSFRRFLATLGMTALFCWPATAQNGNGVTVNGLDVKPGTVTFNVSWNDEHPEDFLWSDTVWVFVEYNNAGKMERLPLSGATLTAPSWAGASVTLEPGNTSGVRVIGNARSAGSFSATVQLLTEINDVAGACAYASNYPPVGEYADATQIKFTGTSMYKIVLEEISGDGILIDISDGSYTMREGYTIQSFTDATGAPGIMKCIVPATYVLQVSALDFCEGTDGVQFALSGTESGVSYQLYNDATPVGSALSGTGSAATFSGAFNEGAYTARTVADDKYCAITMSGTRVVVENPLPVLTVNGNSRNCPGTVTLSASSPGAVIEWYVAIDAASSVYTGVSYTTHEIATSTTYYVQARNESTGCSSARMPVLATVNTENCCHAPGATGITFAAFNPCTATVGSTWTLTDSRDKKTYKVKYMPDGRYWMVQDLKFGSNCGKTSFDYTGSATVTTLVDASGLYYGDCRQNEATTGGYFYSRAAALTKNRVYNTSTDYQCAGIAAGSDGTAPGTCAGICPDGWHVPTLDEYNAALSAWTTHWSITNATAISSTYFDAIPQGTMCSADPCYTAEVWLWTSQSSYQWGQWNGSCCRQDANNRQGAPVRCAMNY